MGRLYERYPNLGLNNYSTTSVIRAGANSNVRNVDLVQQVVDSIVNSSFPIQIIALTNCLIFAMWRLGNPNFMKEHFLSSPKNRSKGYWWSELLANFSQIELHHLAGNLGALAIFGSTCVYRLGATAFFFVIACSTVLCCLIENIWRESPLAPDKVRSRDSLGFSGINSSLFILFTHFSPNEHLVFGNNVCTAKAALISALSADLVGWICDCLDIVESPIDHFAHISGYAAGFLILHMINFQQRSARIINNLVRLIRPHYQSLSFGIVLSVSLICLTEFEYMLKFFESAVQMIRKIYLEIFQF